MNNTAAVREITFLFVNFNYLLHLMVDMYYFNKNEWCMDLISI